MFYDRIGKVSVIISSAGSATTGIALTEMQTLGHVPSSSFSSLCSLHSGSRHINSLFLIQLVFLHFARAVEMEGVRKNSIDTTMYPATAIAGKKNPKISVPIIITTPNCCLRCNA